MIAITDKDELLDLLAWAFNEANVWLQSDRGDDYRDELYKDPMADRIIEILSAHGKKIAAFDN